MRERRQVPRYLLGQEAKVSVPATGALYVVTVEGLSTRGCLTKSGPIPAIGQKCEVALDWHGREMRLQAEVVWKNKDGQAGLKFLAGSDDQLKLLREICATLPLQPLAPPEPEEDG